MMAYPTKSGYRSRVLVPFDDSFAYIATAFLLGDLGKEQAEIKFRAKNVS